MIGVTVVETRLGEPMPIGRQNAVPIEGSESLLEADVVIIAFGFSPSVAGRGWRTWAWKASPTAASSRGQGPPAVPDRASTPVRGGDAVRGADLVVTALAEGPRCRCQHRPPTGALSPAKQSSSSSARSSHGATGLARKWSMPASRQARVCVPAHWQSARRSAPAHGWYRYRHGSPVPARSRPCAAFGSR